MSELEISAWVNGALQEPDERWRQEWQHEIAAISEGLCPVHHEPLDAVAVFPHRIAGHCRPCRRFWGFNTDNEQAGWWLDYDPVNPYRYAVPVPDWMRRG
jgi:hypothetical protein